MSTTRSDPTPILAPSIDPGALADARRGPWLGIAVGLALVGVTTIPKLLFDGAIGSPTPFLLYFGSIMVAAWYGGLTAAIVTTLASAIIGDLLFGLPHESQFDANSLVRLGVFLIEGILIGVVTAGLWRSQQRVSAAADRAAATAAQLDAVLENVADAITVQDTDGKVVYANRHAAELTGFRTTTDLKVASTGELVRRYEVFDPDGASVPFAELPGRSVLAGGPAAERTVVFRDRDTGRELRSELRATPVRDGDGATRFAVNVMRDVTERHRLEEEARVNLEWFRTALASIGDAVIATDADGKVKFLNPVAESLTGWKTADATGRPLAEVFVIADETTHKLVENPVDHVLENGMVVGLANHTVLVARDGSEIPIDDSAAPIKGSDGSLAGVVLVFRDVSISRREDQRRAFLARAGAELSSSLDYEATLATMARLAVPAIADWAAVDILEGGARRRLAIAHIDPARVELVADLDRRYPPDPADPRDVINTGEPLLIPDITTEMIATAARDDTHRRMLERLELRALIAVPLRHRGVTLGAFTIAMAESRRRYGDADLDLALALAGRAAVAIDNARLYRVAAQARDSAELASRAKDDFLAMLGHELRNPLAPIVTALELLEMRGEPALIRERALIERQVRHMVRLVDDLLDVSRISRGRIELERRRVDLATAVGGALEMVGPLIAQRDQHLAIDVPPGLALDADPTRLAQIIANVLTNASKYTEPGGRIQVDGGRDGAWITLAIRDNGIGIPPAMLVRIFDLFVQNPQALDRAQGGLGLGLSIVRSLVQLHGGDITAHSDGPGTGSEFRIRLPAARPPALPV